MKVKASMPVRMNLVVPLAHEATDTRITETAARAQARPGAVAPLIGASLRPDDVESTSRRSPPTLTRGSSTSTAAPRTTTTRTTSSSLELSADSSVPFSFSALVDAYMDCRRSKRNSASALAFEAHLERNLCDLHDELISGAYRPGRSICFVITRPKPREVWAADFRDRVVHHLLYNHVSPWFYASFIANSCACIPGRGTLYAAQRLEHSVRSITENWSVPAHYLKCDLANFFVAIDKHVLRAQLARRIAEPFWLRLTETILFHDPRDDHEIRGHASRLRLVPAHKSLFNAPADTGLPIGNLSSQFFANVFLDELDQHVKHQVRARHYVRYVDDFILLHRDPAWLNAALREISAFLPERLGASLNPRKTILQPVDRGVDFVGHVIKPWRRTTRPRTMRAGLRSIATTPADELFAVGNSYLGLVRQATHSDHERALFANALRRRGHCVNASFTKAYRRPQP